MSRLAALCAFLCGLNAGAAVFYVDPLRWLFVAFAAVWAVQWWRAVQV